MRLILRLRAAAVLVLANLAVAAHGAELKTVPDGYSIHQSVPVHGRSTQIMGYLQVLEDARLTPDLREAMWGFNEPLESLESLGYAKDDPLFDSFYRNQIKTVRIRLNNPAGHRVDEREFDEPLGQIEAEKINLRGSVAYLVTINRGNGSGAYTGHTCVAVISRGKVRWQSVVDDKTRKRNELILSRSMRADWRIAEDASGHRTIVAVADRFPATEGVVDYMRIVFRNGQWHRITRSEIGSWENENNFPDLSKFPPWPQRARHSR